MGIKIMDFLIGGVVGAGLTYAYTQHWLDSIITTITGYLPHSAYTYTYRY